MVSISLRQLSYHHRRGRASCNTETARTVRAGLPVRWPAKHPPRRGLHSGGVHRARASDAVPRWSRRALASSTAPLMPTVGPRLGCRAAGAFHGSKARAGLAAARATSLVAFITPEVPLPLRWRLLLARGSRCALVPRPSFGCRARASRRVCYRAVAPSTAPELRLPALVGSTAPLVGLHAPELRLPYCWCPRRARGLRRVYFRDLVGSGLP